MGRGKKFTSRTVNSKQIELAAELAGSLSVGWYARIEKISEFILKNGRRPSPSIPTESRDYHWLYRHARHWDDLSDDQRSMLAAIGEGPIDPSNKWGKRYEAIKLFKEQNGRLPKRQFEGESADYEWIRKNRLCWEALSEEQRNLLIEIDGAPSDPNLGWMNQFETLKEFINQNSRRPKYDVEEEIPLYRWLARQRHLSNLLKIPSEQRDLLKSIDVAPIDPLKDLMARYHALKASGKNVQIKVGSKSERHSSDIERDY